MARSLCSTEIASSATGAASMAELADATLLARFSANHDERAFSELVRRHGPLVLGVCRRILGDAHSAEDVFQAVFLVLARKSASIRKPELLANWLYGVACRIARKARIKATKEATRERWAVKVATHTQEAGIAVEWTELLHVLDEEVGRLPEKYRAPLVLCYLRGQTNVQAAEQLGWPSGSISDRLAQAREMLRRRLCRRGMNLTAALMAILLTQKVASAGVSSVLASTTVKTAVAGTTHKSGTSLVSRRVLELAREAAAFSLVSVAKVLALSLLILGSAVSIARSQGISYQIPSVISGWTGWNDPAGEVQAVAGSCSSGSRAAAPASAEDPGANSPDH